MNKKIVLLLLLSANIPTQTMQLATHNTKNVGLFNPVLWSCITNQLCTIHDYNPDQIKKDIRALSDTHKFFHDYYAQEAIAQNVIRRCSHYLESNDDHLAKRLNCRAIEKKIDYFTTIAISKEKQFTQADLQEAWYLTIRTGCANRSLLFRTIDHLNVEKAQLIIKHSPKLEFRYGINQNLLLCIAKKRLEIRHHFFHKKTSGTRHKLLTIAKQLLEKKIDPNGGGNSITPLMNAASNADKGLAQLLLEHGADPSIQFYNIFTEKFYNSLDLEQGQPQGWLADIIDDIENQQQS